MKCRSDGVQAQEGDLGTAHEPDGKDAGADAPIDVEGGFEGADPVHAGNEGIV